MDGLARRARTGFTLIELLVVIAVIAILAGIIFPVFVKARDRGKLAKCMSNLRQCGVACFMYCDDNAGYFPIGRITDENGNVIRSWPEGQCVGGQAGILPDTRQPYTPPRFRPLNKYVKSIEVFHCPSELRQDCAGLNNTFPWIRFGSSYNFNLTFHYPDAPNNNPSAVYFTTLVGRKLSDLKSSRRMIMMGERAIHYWYGVSKDRQDPKPLAVGKFLGHANDLPWTPIVFCDGHVDYLLMTPGLNGPKWALAQKGWCPFAPNEGD